ncbi:hypothetical protein [Nocardia fluminea]|uniref:hypothetical protein n=1 Tax=Nocardia fluminea TaxID=134984 RepID=UPI00341E2C96
MHWAYRTWNDPTTADTSQGLFVSDGDLDSVKPDKLRVLVRAYPSHRRDSARTVLRFGDRRFPLRLRPRPASDAPTEIFVSPLHYPNGAQIIVEGGSAKSPVRGNRIQVTADGSGPVSVTIRDRLPAG